MTDSQGPLPGSPWIFLILSWASPCPLREAHSQPPTSAPTQGRRQDPRRSPTLSPNPALPSPDPYVKVWLMYKDKRVEKKKTVTMKRNLNPIFNESFAFDIPTEKLRETTIVITVMDKDKLSRNDVIGKVGPGGGGAPSWPPRGPVPQRRRQVWVSPGPDTKGGGSEPSRPRSLLYPENEGLS